MTKSALLTVALGSGVALLAACSGNGLSGTQSALPGSTSQVQSQSRVSDLARTGIAPQLLSTLHSVAVQPQRKHKALKELAVTDGSLNEILEFNKAYMSTGTISDSGPDGDWIDAKGNLYVANYASLSVTEYNKADSLSFTYSTGLTDPVDVTTDKKGNVIVANFGSGAADVDVFPQGSNTASVVCNTGLANEGVAVDAKGDVFVTGDINGGGKILEYKGGITSSCSATTLTPTITNAGGIQVDKKGDLVVCDQLAAVDIIPPPYTSIGSSIPTSDAFHVALNGTQNLIFIAQPNNNDVLVAKYPSGTTVTTLGSAQGLSLPYGVATYPFAR